MTFEAYVEQVKVRSNHRTLSSLTERLGYTVMELRKASKRITVVQAHQIPASTSTEMQIWLENALRGLIAAALETCMADTLLTDMAACEYLYPLLTPQYTAQRAACDLNDAVDMIAVELLAAGGIDEARLRRVFSAAYWQILHLTVSAGTTIERLREMGMTIADP